MNALQKAQQQIAECLAARKTARTQAEYRANEARLNEAYMAEYDAKRATA